MHCLKWYSGHAIITLYITHSYLHKVGVFGISDCYYCMNFLDQLLLFIIIKLHVPFGQSCFPGSVLDENEADLRKEKITFAMNPKSILRKLSSYLKRGYSWNLPSIIFKYTCQYKTVKIFFFKRVALALAHCYDNVDWTPPNTLTSPLCKIINKVQVIVKRRV